MNEPTELTQAQRHVAALDYELTKQDASERLRFQADFAQLAWKGLAFVNGGSIVALFTFIGNTHPSVDHHKVWVAFGLFAGGLASNLVSIMSGFLAQSYFMKADVSSLWNKQAEMHGYPPQHEHAHLRELRIGNVWEGVAIGACIVSLVAFVTGSFFALMGVTI